MGTHRLSPSPMDDPWDGGAWSGDLARRQLVQDEIDKRIAELGGRQQPTIFVRGAVIAALVLAAGAATYGVTAVPPTTGATHTAPLTATPPAIPAPATVDPIPDLPMDVPPVLTPSLVQHGHHASLNRSQTARVLATADTTPQPAEVPAPVQTAPVPEPTPTVREPQPSTTWVPQYAYPTSQPQQRHMRSGSPSHHHHGRNYDFDHDGDSH